MLVLLGLLLDLLLLVVVPDGLLGVVQRRDLVGAEPGVPRRLLDLALDPLGLVEGPLVRGQGLLGRGLRLRHQRLVDGRAGQQRGDGGESREDGGGEGDLLEEAAALPLQHLGDVLAQLVGFDLGTFGHGIAPWRMRYRDPIAPLAPAGKSDSRRSTSRWPQLSPGSGRLKKNPWTSSQPWSRSSRHCASVSTPSATTRMSRLCARAITAEAISRLPLSSDSERMKEASIFRVSMGKLRR